MAESGWPGWLGWLALYFGIAMAGTWLARGYALRHRLLDLPGERRSHDTPTPRGGGIAIVAALLVALAWLALHEPGTAPRWIAIAIGLLLVAGIGWIDDHRPLSPWLRLIVHTVAAASLAWGIHLAGGSVAAVACAFTLALVLVNIWNFMDGIDGLAASQAVLAALGYALLAGPGTNAWLALVLAAACAGFLPFNLPKARIFLGDVGSGTLGFALATLAALQFPDLGWARAPVLFLPLSAFVIDATLTLGTRMVRGDHWWLPHTEHAYQRWTRSSGRHDTATWAYAGWTLATVAIMLALKSQAPAVIMLVLGATTLIGCASWWRLQRMARGVVRGDRE